MKQATLLFLINEGKILLAMKKRGFGVGKWNGVGGKPLIGEEIEQTAIRECFEEIGVTPHRILEVATLNFYFPSNKRAWNQQVIVYVCRAWDGTPSETEEMAPQWFMIKDIPYESMWSDDVHWLPRVIEGNYVDAEFRFDDNDILLDYDVDFRNIATEAM